VFTSLGWASEGSYLSRIRPVEDMRTSAAVKEVFRTKEKIKSTEPHYIEGATTPSGYGLFGMGLPINMKTSPASTSVVNMEKTLKRTLQEKGINHESSLSIINQIINPRRPSPVIPNLTEAQCRKLLQIGISLAERGIDPTLTIETLNAFIGPDSTWLIFEPELRSEALQLATALIKKNIYPPEVLFDLQRLIHVKGFTDTTNKWFQVMKELRSKVQGVSQQLETKKTPTQTILPSIRLETLNKNIRLAKPLLWFTTGDAYETIEDMKRILRKTCRGKDIEDTKAFRKLNRILPHLTTLKTRQQLVQIGIGLAERGIDPAQTFHNLAVQMGIEKEHRHLAVRRYPVIEQREQERLFQMVITCVNNGINPEKALGVAPHLSILEYNRPQDRRLAMQIGIHLAEHGIDPHKTFSILTCGCLPELSTSYREYKFKTIVLQMADTLAKMGQDPCEAITAISKPLRRTYDLTKREQAWLRSMPYFCESIYKNSEIDHSSFIKALPKLEQYFPKIASFSLPKRDAEQILTNLVRLQKEEGMEPSYALGVILPKQNLVEVGVLSFLDATEYINFPDNTGIIYLKKSINKIVPVFVHTEKAFNSLKVSKLAIGTQAYIKLLILDAALNDNLDDTFMNKLKTEAMPALRVLEALSKDYPTLGMELQLPYRKGHEGSCQNALKEILLANFLSVVHTPHEMGRSTYTSDKTYQFRLPPTVYPIFLLMVAKLNNMGIIKAGHHYITTVAGDYLEEAALLSTCLFYNHIPTEAGIKPVVPAYDKVQAGVALYPGIGGRFIGATVDPWTGRLLDQKDKKTKGTQTCFFHSMYTSLLLKTVEEESGRVLKSKRFNLFEDDLERTFLLITAAAAYLGAYQIKDNTLRNLYTSFRSRVMGFFIDKFGIKGDDIEKIFPKIEKGQQYTSIGSALSEIHNVMKNLDGYFAENPATYKEFQSIVNEAVDSIKEYLFTRDRLKGRILRLALDKQWGRIRPTIESAAFGEEEKLAITLLKAGRYPNAKDIEQALIQERGGTDRRPSTSPAALEDLPIITPLSITNIQNHIKTYINEWPA